MRAITRCHREWALELRGRDAKGAPACCCIIPQEVEWNYPYDFCHAVEESQPMGGWPSPEIRERVLTRRKARWDFGGMLTMAIELNVADCSARIEDSADFGGLTDFLEQLSRVRESNGSESQFENRRLSSIRVHSLRGRGLYAVRVAMSSYNLVLGSIAKLLMRWPDYGTPVKLETAFVMSEGQLTDTIAQGDQFRAAMWEAKQRIDAAES